MTLAQRGIAPTMRSFKTKMCDYLPNCPNGDNCSFAHHPSEIQRGPNYKTSICRNWPGNCRAGDACNFAHGEHDIRSGDRYGGGRTGVGRPQHFGGIGGRFGGRGGARQGGGGFNRRDHQRSAAMSRIRNRRAERTDRSKSNSRSRKRSRSRSPSQKENKRSARRQHSRSSESESVKSKVKPDSHKDDGGERERDSVDHNGHSKDTKSSNVSSKRRRHSSTDSKHTSSNNGLSPSVKLKKRRRIVENLSTKTAAELDELILKAISDREAASAELRQTKEDMETQKESMKEYDTTMQERLTKLKKSLEASVNTVQTLKAETRAIQKQLDEADEAVAQKQREVNRAKSEHKQLIDTVRTHLENAVESIAKRGTEIRDLSITIKKILSNESEEDDGVDIDNASDE